MTRNERTVTISQSEYVNLIKDQTKFYLLREALFNSCSLSSYKNDLYFDDNKIDSAIKAICPNDYNWTLNCLTEKEKKEEDF